MGNAARQRRAGQLALFADLVEAAVHPVQAHRPKIPPIPIGLDLAALAAALDDPDPTWETRARCRRRPDLTERFHEVVVVQRRSDGTEGYCLPGDYTPEGYQAWCAGCTERTQCIASALLAEAPNYRAGFYGSTPTQRTNIADALGGLTHATAS